MSDNLVLVDHIVDCDADPFIPEGWSLEGEGAEHRKNGKVRLERRGDDLYANGRKIELFLSENQKNGKCIEGHELRKELAQKPVLNANILDYLLAHQELIPESWKGKYVFFWGTIYRDSCVNLYVRCLDCGGDGCYWDCSWLGSVFSDDYPAAVSASQALEN